MLAPKHLERREGDREDADLGGKIVVKDGRPVPKNVAR